MRLDENLQVVTPPFKADGGEIGLRAWMETWRNARPHTLVVRLEILKALAGCLGETNPPQDSAAWIRHAEDISLSWRGDGTVTVSLGPTVASFASITSFGGLAYELLAGEVGAAQPSDQCKDIPPSKRCAGIPPLLDEIVRDACHGGYAAVADLQNDLNEVHLLLPFSLSSLRFPPEVLLRLETSPAPEIGIDCYVGRYPVTNGDFKDFAFQTGFMPTNPGDLEDDERRDHPVTGISVEVADLYCKWVGGRLPTEAEWQLICSGPEGYPYPWGSDEGKAGYGNWGGTEKGTTSVKAHPAGKGGPRKPEDLIGNVWEMCLAPPGSAMTPIKGGSFRWPQLNCWNKREIIARACWSIPGIQAGNDAHDVDIDLGQVGWRVLWLPTYGDIPLYGEARGRRDALGRSEAEKLAGLCLTRSRLARTLGKVVEPLKDHRDSKPLSNAYRAFTAGKASFHGVMALCASEVRRKVLETLEQDGIPCFKTDDPKSGFIRSRDPSARNPARPDSDLFGLNVLPVNPDYEGLPKVLGLSAQAIKADHCLIFATPMAYDPILRAWLERTFDRPCLLVLAEMGFITGALEAHLSKEEGRLDLRRGETIDPRRDRITDPSQVDAMLCRHISDAAQRDASDIHIEPSTEGIITRYRIDGSLEQVGIHQPSEMAKVFAARVKIMAQMDVVQRRLPQDGSIHATSPKDGSLLDLRVSTLPTSEGETIVMRLLPQSQGIKNLGGLGLTDDQLEMLSNALAVSHGLILVSGPTGSGKSTTLYACLNALMDRPKNLVTIEDPVEYRLPRVSQMEVNHRIGRTFESGLRAVLRQDPDIIMVGEIRDEVSGRLAIEAAQTGHLVLSTVHTNDAPGIIDRLVNFGIPRFAIADSLILGIAQRLVRRLCPHCAKNPVECTWEDLLRRNENFGMSPAFARKMVEDLGLFDIHGYGLFFVPPEDGCDKCSKGYRGRIAVYEMFPSSDPVRAAILDTGGDAAGLRKVAGPDGGGLPSMSAAARQLILDDKTTVEEVLRVLARN